MFSQLPVSTASKNLSTSGGICFWNAGRSVNQLAPLLSKLRDFVGDNLFRSELRRAGAMFMGCVLMRRVPEEAGAACCDVADSSDAPPLAKGAHAGVGE